MQVTDLTLYADFELQERFVTEASKKALMEEAQKRFGNMYDLSFAQFRACAGGDFGEMLGNLTNPTVFQVYWMKRFSEFVDEFVNILKTMTLPQKPEEQQAAQGLLKTQWDESMLVFIREYFGLHSFYEAEKITIGEIVIAKRDTYNREKFQRRLMEIQLTKAKRK